MKFSPLFALAGLGDVPNFIFIMAFSFWPFHISTALGITGYDLRLGGFGTAAVVCQCFMLFLLIVAAPFVFRSQRIRGWVKVLYLLLGYPLVTVATNLIPAFL
ncbi:MAG: hypothetical protein JWM68_2762 [Verrucomicrobiales bacterium]|nr:hypothetical protein [Verrucomicrobiales bacterium]